MNTMDAIKQKNEALANDLKNFIMRNHLNMDVRIYFNGKCYDWCNGEAYFKEPIVLEDIHAKDFFDYGNNETVSMSFEGAFYEIVNYGGGSEAKRIMREFNAIFKKYNSHYELGNAWNLSAYYD